MKKLLIGILIVLMLSIASVSANPILNLIGNKMVNENQALQFDITCSAPDSGSTSFLKNSSIGSLTKVNNQLATFSWTPGYEDEGVYTIKFTAFDTNSSDNQIVTITVQNTNRAPQWTSSVPSQTILEDSSLFVVGNVNNLVSDPDGDSLTFSIGYEDVNKVDCMVDSDGTDLKIMPAADFSGTTNCSVRATDGSLYTDSSFVITVTGTSDAPVITSSPITTADINKSYSYDVAANDPDGDTLIYSLTVAPAGMNINSNSGLISWTPNVIGNFDVKVQVTDGSISVEQSFAVAVDYPSKLEIYDLDAWVDGDTEGGVDTNGGTVDKDVEPESEIKLRLKLLNAYTSSEDIDIEDIEISAVLEGIDEDGDDLETEVSMDDLGPGDKDSVYLYFDIPLRAEEGEYDLILTITANDVNRDYDIELEMTVDVTRNSHDVRVSRVELTPETLVCSRHANVNVEIMNIGDNDEDTDDKIKLTIESSALGIDFSQNYIELDSDPDADDNTFEKTLSIDLENDFPPGTYYVKANVYRGSSIMDSVEKPLVIEQCTLSDLGASGGVSGQQTTGDQVLINTGADLSSQLPPEFQGYMVDTEETSFTNSGLYLAILIIAILAVLGTGVFLAVKFLKKPKTGMGQFNY